MIIVAFGAIAQLVEHLHGMQGVSGSNPLSSIFYIVLCGSVKLVLTGVSHACGNPVNGQQSTPQKVFLADVSST